MPHNHLEGTGTQSTLKWRRHCEMRFRTCCKFDVKVASIASSSVGSSYKPETGNV